MEPVSKEHTIGHNMWSLKTGGLLVTGSITVKCKTLLPGRSGTSRQVFVMLMVSQGRFHCNTSSLPSGIIRYYLCPKEQFLQTGAINLLDLFGHT